MKIKLLNSQARIPTFGSDYAAGYDLYASSAATILPHSTVKISTGLAMEIPNGYFGAIFARSGLATKEGLRPANCVGVIDSDYRGEILVAMHNDSDQEKDIESGQRIAQLVLIPYLREKLLVVNELSNTDRNNGGFGSTGK